MATTVNYIGSVDTLYILNKIKSVLENGYVAIESGKGLSTNDFTTELMNTLTASADKLDDIAEGATKTSISNLLSTGTKVATITINDTPADIYIPQVTIDSAMSDTSENPVQNKIIKDYVDSAIGSVKTIEFKIVDRLPATGESNIIYLVPNEGSAPNAKDEYVWIASENAFEKIGSTTIDLSSYVQFDDLVEISTKDIDDMFSAVWPS